MPDGKFFFQDSFIFSLMLSFTILFVDSTPRNTELLPNPTVIFALYPSVRLCSLMIFGLLVTMVGLGLLVTKAGFAVLGEDGGWGEAPGQDNVNIDVKVYHVTVYYDHIDIGYTGK